MLAQNTLGEKRSQGVSLLEAVQARGHERQRGEMGNANGIGRYEIYKKKTFIRIILTRNIFGWKFMGPIPKPRLTCA